MIALLASKLTEIVPAFPVLQSLSFLSYSAEPSNYSEPVRTLLRYCTLADDKTCRVALVSVGNLHRPEVTDEVFRHVVDLLLKMTQSPGTVTLCRLKLLMSTMQVLSQVLPSVNQLEPAFVANLFFAIQKLLTLGSFLKPFLDVSGIVSSSSDQSDADSSMSYVDKVMSKLRTCSLISLQELFKKHSKLLFSYWGSLFAEKRDDRQMSLNYLLTQDHTKTIAAYTIAVIIDNSPLSKWVFNAGDAGKGMKGFTPFSQSVAAIVKILHEDLALELQHEVNSHTLTALIKASISLLSQCPYTNMQPGLLRSLAVSLVDKWNECDFSNRGVLLQAFNWLLQANHTEVEDLFNEAIVQDMVSTESAEDSDARIRGGSPHCKDLLLERMGVTAKLAKYFPYKLKEQSVIELVRCNLMDSNMLESHWPSKDIGNFVCNDVKLTSATLLVLEELARQPGNLAEFAAEVVVKCINHPASVISSLSLITSLIMSNVIETVTIKSQVQASCVKFLESCNAKVPDSVAIRSALFKFCAAYSSHSLCSDEAYRTILSLLTKCKDDSSLAVSIQASAALAASCTSHFAQRFIPNLVQQAIQRSQSKKEKIASNGVIAIGNLLEHTDNATVEPFLDNLVDLLFSSCAHKNIKVCWDSCKALLKAASRGLLTNQARRLCRDGLQMLNQHPNFKTRVYLVQLLDSFADCLSEDFVGTASLLLSSISVENPTDAASYSEQKHKIEFKQATVRLLARLASQLQEDFDISDFINQHAAILCSELYECLHFYVHEQTPEGHDPVIHLFREAGRRLHYHSEREQAQVSFGTVERFAALANFSVSDAPQLLYFTSAADDVNIGLKSQLTQNLP